MASKSKVDKNELHEEEIDEEIDSVSEDEVNESGESAGVPAGASKTNMMSVLMKHMGNLKGSKMVDFFNSVQATIGKESDGVPSGAAAKNKASIAMKGAIKEDLESVFGNDKTLSEEFKEKMTTIFEAAVSARVTLIEAELVEQAEEAFEARLVEATDALHEHTERYLNALAGKWLEENQVAVESTLRMEIAEDLLAGIKQVFAESNVAIPEDRVDAFDVLAAKVEEMEEALNDVIKENMEMGDVLSEYRKAELIDHVAEGLTLTQKEKFKTLAEGVDFDETEEAFVKKLNVLAEHQFPETKKKPAKSGIVNESIGDTNEDEGVKTPKAETSNYFRSLSRTSHQ
jgi:hypothetical protein